MMFTSHVRTIVALCVACAFAQQAARTAALKGQPV
jgi:hypothetical protein